MYLVMAGIVALFAMIGYLDRKSDEILFCIELCLMGAMLCLRYGQGTDYFAYEVTYALAPQSIDIHFLFHNDIHGEVGYMFIEEIFRNFGISFLMFVMVWSFVIMLMTFYGIKRYARIKTIAVLMLYPTYYLTFYYGIRQGFVMAFVLCFVLPAYVNNEKWKYILLVCLSATIHTSSLILLVPMLFGKIIQKYKQITVIGAMGFGIGLGLFLKITNIKIGHYVYFNVSYNALILRVILFIAITQLYYISRENDNINNRIYNFYMVGFYIYLALFPVSFIAQRATAYMKLVEIILFSRLLGNIEGGMYVRKSIIMLKRHVCLLIIAICMVEGVKNINSYIAQGEYHSGIHFYNYPYVSVFNKKDIYKYRENEFLDAFPDVFDY